MYKNYQDRLRRVDVEDSLHNHSTQPLNSTSFIRHSLPNPFKCIGISNANISKAPMLKMKNRSNVPVKVQDIGLGKLADSTLNSNCITAPYIANNFKEELMILTKSSTSFRDTILKRSKTENRAMTAAAVCSKEVCCDLIKKAFPEKEREEKIADCKRIHDENYKQGIRFFADLIQNRDERIGVFMSRANGKKARNKTPLDKKVNRPAKQLKRIIDNIKMLGVSHNFATKSCFNDSADKRQRRMNYGKWYLKPGDYSKSHYA
eukprot:TRINITY_DN3905_c0_g3_i3.p1 TRINITY_DN3905_c0_g3~~TRINITY_DN3905_c0_g3_i3.p1  ORF type:complete len:288 (+),score=48.23 TRINITY_DN3905_c0_g3_i3:79-864(+)